jgi:diguanylate cyclase (GGDEF)-like protein
MDAAALLTAAFMSVGGNSLDLFDVLFLVIVGQAFFLSHRGFWPRLALALAYTELVLITDGGAVWLDLAEPIAMALIAVLVFLMHNSREAVRMELREQAARDPLTGLLNRRAMQARFEAAAARLRDGNTSFAVFYIDLDDFKAVNDAHGHDVGDELLVAAARRIERVMRSDDTVGRLGGDEFAVLLGSVTTPACVEDVARRLVAQLQAPYAVNEVPVTLSASVGIAVASPTHRRTAEELLREADRAMYTVKRGDKGAYAFTSSDELAR